MVDCEFAIGLISEIKSEEVRKEEGLTSVPPMAGTMIKGMKISEPASER